LASSFYLIDQMCASGSDVTSRGGASW